MHAAGRAPASDGRAASFTVPARPKRDVAVAECQRRVVAGGDVEVGRIVPEVDRLVVPVGPDEYPSLGHISSRDDYRWKLSCLSPEYKVVGGRRGLCNMKLLEQVLRV